MVPTTDGAVVEGTVVTPTKSEEETDGAAPSFVLDEEASPAEWYYSVEGLEETPTSSAADESDDDILSTSVVAEMQ